jgi:hypothetical protein
MTNFHNYFFDYGMARTSLDECALKWSEAENASTLACKIRDEALQAYRTALGTYRDALAEYPEARDSLALFHRSHIQQFERNELLTAIDAYNHKCECGNQVDDALDKERKTKEALEIVLDNSSSFENRLGARNAYLLARKAYELAAPADSTVRELARVAYCKALVAHDEAIVAWDEAATLAESSYRRSSEEFKQFLVAREACRLADVRLRQAADAATLEELFTALAKSEGVERREWADRTIEKLPSLHSEDLTDLQEKTAALATLVRTIATALESAVSQDRFQRRRFPMKYAFSDQSTDAVPLYDISRAVTSHADLRAAIEAIEGIGGLVEILDAGTSP